MQRKTAADFHPEVLHWFDKYVHGHTNRRGFLDGVAKSAAGGVTATMLLEALSPRFAAAQKVARDDPRIGGGYVECASPDGSGTMRGYLVLPASAAGKLPGLLVVHENRGLNPHIGCRPGQTTSAPRSSSSRRRIDRWQRDSSSQ